MEKHGRVRGRPFPKGNPGRPKGACNKPKFHQLLAERTDGDAVDIYRATLDLAKSGNRPSCRIVNEIRREVSECCKVDVLRSFRRENPDFLTLLPGDLLKRVMQFESLNERDCQGWDLYAFIQQRHKAPLDQAALAAVQQFTNGVLILCQEHIPDESKDEFARRFEELAVRTIKPLAPLSVTLLKAADG